MLEDAKKMYQLQKQAKKIKKELKNTHIEAEEAGVIITINGEQEVVDVQISDEAMQLNSAKLNDILKKCFNKGIKKSQEVAADMMKDVMGGMNIPGLS